MARKHFSQSCVIDIGPVDWMCLAAQKQQIAEWLRKDSEGETNLSSIDINVMEGILSFLDHIQDRAYDFAHPVVYGNTENAKQLRKYLEKH